MPASSKKFLGIQGTIECGFTLKYMRNMIRTYRQNYIVITVNLLQIISKQSQMINCGIVTEYSNFQNIFIQVLNNQAPAKKKNCILIIAFS